MGADNVTGAKPKVGGAIYRGSSATATLPTDTTTTLTGFNSLGYIADDGLTNSNSPAANVVKAWGGDTVLADQTDRPDTFKFKLLESMDPNVLKTVYGENAVTGTAVSSGISVAVSAKDLEIRPYVVDMVLKNNVAKRICIPSAKVVAVGDIVYVGGNAVAYDVTLQAFADSTGNTHYEYLKAPSTTSS